MAGKVLTVSRNRLNTPQPQKPFTISIQANLQQGHFQQGLHQHVGYDQAIAQKPESAETYNSRGIEQANLTRFEDALASFDKAIALKPDYAQAYNNRGIVLQDLERFDDALVSFDRAIALKPDNAWAHNNRGVVLQALRRPDEALANYDRAIACKPDYAEAYYNRGIVLQDLGRLDDALIGFDKAIALKPDYAEAYNNRGIVLQDLRRPDDALASYDQAIALTPDYAEAYSNQSHSFLQMGRFEQGWRLHEWRKKTAIPVGNRLLPKPLWLGSEDISNRTLFVHCEQGLGDTIQFCRYGKLLTARGIRVVMAVQEPLHRLLNQMSPGIQIIRHGEVPAAYDYHCALMSLPLALGTTLATIPAEQRYIFADEPLRKAWAARLPPRTKPGIGIVWSGSRNHKNDRNRSIDLRTLGALFSADAHWISLQKGLGDGDSTLLRDFHNVIACGDELRDFSDTAAVIDLLDLVITVDTSVAHLAGAMGKRVWILLPYNSDWRWLLDRNDSPWYPSVRLFRQNDARSWGNVVARVQAALKDFI